MKVFKPIYRLRVSSMKHNKILFVLLFVGSLAIFLSGCQPSFKYDSFSDLDKKGPEAFSIDLKTCRSYGNSNSKRTEGSQGAGERLLLNRNLILICMKNKQWKLKNS